MKVRIKAPISKTAPDLHGRGVDFEAGEEVIVRDFNYPGKYHPWLPNNQYTDWDFWESTDTDLSIIFKAEEIEALILSPQEKHKLKDAPFNSAPFKVVVNDEAL